MSDIEIIAVGEKPRQVRISIVMPGDESTLAAAQDARRSGKRLKLRIDNPEILNPVAKQLVERGPLGRPYVVVPGGWIRTARLK